MRLICLTSRKSPEGYRIQEGDLVVKVNGVPATWMAFRNQWFYKGVLCMVSAKVHSFGLQNRALSIFYAVELDEHDTHRLIASWPTTCQR